MSVRPDSHPISNAAPRAVNAVFGLDVAFIGTAAANAQLASTQIDATRPGKDTSYERHAKVCQCVLQIHVKGWRACNIFTAVNTASRQTEGIMMSAVMCVSKLCMSGVPVSPQGLSSSRHWRLWQYCRRWR